MVKVALTVLVGITISCGVVPAFVAPAFAKEADLHHPAKGAADLHHPAKGATGGVHGAAAKGLAPAGLGGAGAGVAAGIFGAAIGATVIDALGHANSPAPPPP